MKLILEARDVKVGLGSARYARKWTGRTDEGVEVNCWALDPDAGLAHLSLDLAPTPRALVVPGWPGFAREWKGESLGARPAWLWLLSIDARAEAFQPRVDRWLGALPPPQFDGAGEHAPAPGRRAA